MIDADRPRRTISYRQYASTVRSIAAGLQAEGLQNQDCVALLSETDIYYHTLGDGIIAAGGIFCPLQTSDKPAEVIHQLKAASVKWLFASSRSFDLAVETAEAAGLPASKVFLYDPPGLDAGSTAPHTLSRLLSTDYSKWQNPNAGRDPTKILAMRMFSSGTTGSPKAANISHAARIYHLYRPIMGAAERVVVPATLICIPLYHATSTLLYNMAVIGALRTHITSEKSVEDLPVMIDILRTFSIDTMFLPPRFLKPFVDCVRNGTRNHEDIACLKVVRSGGSAVDAGHIQAFKDTFPNCGLQFGYGTTETGLIANVDNVNDFIPGHVGTIHPDVEVKIIDPDTLQEVPRGEVGEIAVRGIHNFSGYHDNHEANTASILPDSAGNWFRTGDKGYIDIASSQLALSGRYKEIFKVAHRDVSPDEVEFVLMQYSAIEDAAIIPVPAQGDANELEVRAYVVPKDKPTAITAQQVASHVAQHLSRHKVPTGGVIFCDEIPRNAMKKVVRRKLKDLAVREGSKEWLRLEN